MTERGGALGDRPTRHGAAALAAAALAACAAVAPLAAARAQGIPCNGSTLVSSKPPPAARPWTDPSLPPDRRADLLLVEMTLEEKIDMATGEWCLLYGFYNAPVERLGIPALTMADGPAGIRIPYQHVNGGRATLFAAPIAIAASWDPALAHAQGDLIGGEAFATGHNVLLGPTLDLARDPLAGRNFEGFGEDPLLASRMAVPFIQGIQSHPVLADAKHFAVYNQEKDRFDVDAHVDERPLRELYLRPFEAAVKDGDVATVMCSFNRVNGAYACEDQVLITQILKGEMGFQGFVMSDFGGTHSTVGSAAAGLDQELAQERYYGWALDAAVQRGDVAPALVDDKARRIVRAMFERGLFDTPVAVAPLPERDHGARSREIAEQGVVLLKNQGLLPLSADGLRSIALIGPDAADASTQGGGAARVEPTYAVTALDGLRQRAGPAVRVEWAPGTDPVSPAHLLPGLPAVPSAVLTPPGGDPAKHGVRAQFWLDGSFDGAPDVTRVDPQVAHSSGFFDYPSVNASAVPQLPSAFSLTRYAARFSATLTAPATGDYTFELTCRGQGRLYLDGARVLDDPAPHPLASRSVQVHLGAGERHELRVDYSASSPEIGVAVDTGGDVKLGWTPPPGTASPSVRDAAALAAASDVAVVVVRDYGTEERDRLELALPDDQDALIQAVAAANPRTVVVLTTGQPTAMPWLDAVPAVLEAWYPGEEQGNVIARVLFGDVNPSGKLPLTFPKTVDGAFSGAQAQQAAASAQAGPRADYAEGLLIGYRWYDAKGVEPLFPFGYGLSYTEFRYEDLKVESPTRVSFTLRNTGARAGAEVAQVYLGPCPGDGAAPPSALAGFAKVALAPGESQRVAVDLGADALSSWSADQHAWTTPSCQRALHVASSSRDVRLDGTIGPGGGSASAGGGSGGDAGASPSSRQGAGSGCAQGGARAAAVPALALAAALVALRRRRRGGRTGRR
jgi:beta-glucosidase